MPPRARADHRCGGADSGTVFPTARVASGVRLWVPGTRPAPRVRKRPPQGTLAQMKRVLSAEEAIRQVVFDGATLMVGGCGLVGKPLTLVRALNQSPFKD